MRSALQNALWKCARRHPGESVTLTDDEVRELLTDFAKSGAEEALGQVNTAMVRKLRDEVEMARRREAGWIERVNAEEAHANRLAAVLASLLEAFGQSKRFPQVVDTHDACDALGAHERRRGSGVGA